VAPSGRQLFYLPFLVLTVSAGIFGCIFLFTYLYEMLCAHGLVHCRIYSMQVHAGCDYSELFYILLLFYTRCSLARCHQTSCGSPLFHSSSKRQLTNRLPLLCNNSWLVFLMPRVWQEG